MEVFPRDYVRRYVDISCANLGVDTIDLLQLHVWEDDWLANGDLQRTVAELKKEGSIRAFGISLNRWEPWNGVKAVESGLVDAVQVIYNIFDQAPEDELFPACRDARSGGHRPGALRRGQSHRQPDPPVEMAGRRLAKHLLRALRTSKSSVAHADALKPLVPPGMTMAEMALRFILSNPDVSTVIPGMRKTENVEANTAAERRRPAASGAHREAAQASLGSPADDLEPIGPALRQRLARARAELAALASLPYREALSRAILRRTAGRIPPWR